MTHFIAISQWYFLGYFVLMALFYLILDGLAFLVLRRYLDRRFSIELPSTFSGLEPPISIIVPAYNEAATVTTSIRSLLQLHYPEYEIVVVNDGSTDETMEVLKREFGLVPCQTAWRKELESKPVRGVYQSTLYPNIRVVDKENGRKADANNAGIMFSLYPLFCAVDADSILQRDTLIRAVRPFLDDPLCIVSGGTVRIANGCMVKSGFLTDVSLPGHPVALLQVMEYMRAFLFGRLGLEAVNAVLQIPGAFGLFRRDVVIEARGYRTDTVGEDLELVLRLHRTLPRSGRPYRIHFVPDPICWTDAPELLSSLGKQRTRWQRGLCESVAFNWGLLFNRRSGAAGWFAFPGMLVFEWLSPLVEFIGLGIILLAVLLGVASLKAFLTLVFVVLSLGTFLSVCALLLEEKSFHLYPKFRHLVVLLLVAVLENFGYRQLNSWWRLKGFCLWLFGSEAKWDALPRSTAWQQKR